MYKISRYVLHKSQLGPCPYKNCVVSLKFPIYKKQEEASVETDKIESVIVLGPLHGEHMLV
jgi:hypothetical protein